MAEIMVPEQVFPGFKIITDLNDIQLTNLIKFLKTFDIGKYYGDIANELSEILKIDGDELLRTLLSFTELIETDVAILSKNLAESYKELSKVGISSEKTNKLIINLLEILSNFERIQLVDKVRQYRVENSNNFREFKLISDIRFIQSDEQSEKGKYGIILHKFCIEYQNSIPHNELHLHISLENLIELKAEIEKAIKRDKMLRESTLGEIKLI